MGNPKAFLTVHRKEAGYRPKHERILDYGEVEQTLNAEDRLLQASRCMDCGVPFCQYGCPLGNKMPEWQDFIYTGNWKKAMLSLQSTNDFPEFTGRVCPAPCEKTCVLAIHDSPVTIRENEAAVMEQAFSGGYMKPKVPNIRTGKKVAVIGSGPAGMAVANQLNQKGHLVTVYEKDNSIGGLLRYGIPDFKLNKSIVERRVNLMREEGIEFITGVEIGKDIQSKDLYEKYDAICIAIGSQVPRNLSIEGRELQGVHYAMEYLTMQNKLVAGEPVAKEELINAKDKNVLVIGGGDTGSDCVGTANRQGAASITQIEILPQPKELKEVENRWPVPFPVYLKTSSSHQEGSNRRWALNTKKFIGENGKLTAVELVEVEWSKDETGKFIMKETGKIETLKVDLVFLALGFAHPIQEGFLEEMEIIMNERKNIHTDEYRKTNIDKVFAAGDCVSGQSLVVTSIASGRKTAEHIDEFLAKQ